MQLRPCFLVIDSEHASSISTRKLVLETAKYNVITTYSCDEAEATLQRFPRVSAVVLNGTTPDRNASGLLETLLQYPDVKLVVVGEGPLTQGPRPPDALVESFAPAKLLRTLESLFPTEAMQLQEHEDDLERGFA